MDGIKIVEKKISLDHLKQIAKERFGDMVKAVVDVERGIMAVGGELHADEEALLLEQGSKQENLWGINLYLEKPKSEWLEFDSMINIRPGQNNLSRSVENTEIQKAIVNVVDLLT